MPSQFGTLFKDLGRIGLKVMNTLSLKESPLE